MTPMTSLQTIGKQIRAARKKKGLFKTQLSHEIGVHRNTLNYLEAGEGNVELKTLIAVCEGVGLAIKLVPKELADTACPEVEHMAPTVSELLRNRLEEPKKGA